MTNLQENQAQAGAQTAPRSNPPRIAEFELSEDGINTFGEKIRYYRTKKGMTQGDLAEKLQIHPATVGAVERGTGVESYEDSHIEQYAAALGVPPYALVSTPKSAAEFVSILIASATAFGLEPSVTGRSLTLNMDAPFAKKVQIALRTWWRLNELHNTGTIDEDSYESSMMALPQIVADGESRRQ